MQYRTFFNRSNSQLNVHVIENKNVNSWFIEKRFPLILIYYYGYDTPPHPLILYYKINLQKPNKQRNKQNKPQTFLKINFSNHKEFALGTNLNIAVYCLSCVPL